MPDNEAPLGGDDLQADPTAGQVSEDTSATEPQDNDADAGEDDPIASLTARLDALGSDYASTKRMVAQISSAAGRIPNLVRDLQSLAAKNPLADIQPRIDEVTELLDTVISNLDDVAFKQGGAATLEERRRALIQKRATERLRQEILDEVRPQNINTTDDDDSDAGIEAPAAEFIAAQSRIAGYAEAIGVSVADIPENELTFRAGETVADAERRVKAAVKAIADGKATAEGIAQRKRSAGNGSAPRGGGAATNDDALLKRFGDGDSLSDEERGRVEKLLAGVLR